MSELSGEHELAQKKLAKAESNESRLGKELYQAKMELNSLAETCTQQKVDYEMELAQAQLALNQQIGELNARLSSSEMRVNELESELAAKNTRIDELNALEASLREQIDGKESTIAILKNSLLMVKSTK